MIVADAVRISSDPTIFAMILKLLDDTDTELVLSRCIGKKHMEIATLEEERVARRKTGKQDFEEKMEDMVEKLDAKKKEVNRKMSTISKIQIWKYIQSGYGGIR